MNRKGFAPIIALFIVLAILIVGGAWYYEAHKTNLGPGENFVYALSSEKGAGDADYAVYAYNIPTQTSTLLFYAPSSTLWIYKYGPDSLYLTGLKSGPSVVDLHGNTVQATPPSNLGISFYNGYGFEGFEGNQYGENFSPDHQKLIYPIFTTSTASPVPGYFVLDIPSGQNTPIALTKNQNEVNNTVVGWSSDNSVAYLDLSYGIGPYMKQPDVNMNIAGATSSLLAINTKNGETSIPNVQIPPLSLWVSGYSLEYFPDQNLLVRTNTSCAGRLCMFSSPPSNIEVINTLTGTSTIAASSDNQLVNLVRFFPSSGEILYALGNQESSTAYIANISNVTGTQKKILSGTDEIITVDDAGQFMLVAKNLTSDIQTKTYIEKIDGSNPVELWGDGTYDLTGGPREPQFIGWY